MVLKAKSTGQEEKCKFYSVERTCPDDYYSISAAFALVLFMVIIIPQTGLRETRRQNLILHLTSTAFPFYPHLDMRCSGSPRYLSPKTALYMDAASHPPAHSPNRVPCGDSIDSESATLRRYWWWWRRRCAAGECFPIFALWLQLRWG